jgi:hypothetical protein
MPRSTPTAMVDRSGSITTGGTSQVLVAARAGRQYLLVQNISDTVLWVNFDGVAAAADSTSVMLSAASATASGGAVEFGAHTGVCPSGAVTIIGATTGKKFVSKEA